MAIILPLTPPAIGPASEFFEIERVDYLTVQKNGRVSGVTAGFPLWRGRWTLSNGVTRQTSEEWRALVSSLRGGQRGFFGRDYGRPYPLTTPRGFTGLSRAGGGAFDGTGASWSLNGDRDVVGVTGLPASQILSVGDYMMWRWVGNDVPGLGSARRALCRVVDAATATSGGVIGVSVEPPLPTLVPPSAVLDLARPCCVMKLDTSQTQLGEKGRTLRISGQIAGVQDLRP